MRVGHDDREAAAAELREHYATGRLTLEELNERLDKAFAARTRGDLDALMTDLPSAGPSAGAGAGWTPGTGSGSRQSGSGRDSRPGGLGPGAGQRAGQTVGALLAGLAVIAAIFAVGLLAMAGGFGIGVGRPLGIVLVLAAVAFLRRLLFGHRRHHVRPGRARRRW
jgi:hypothetical protein